MIRIQGHPYAVARTATIARSLKTMHGVHIAGRGGTSARNGRQRSVKHEKSTDTQTALALALGTHLLLTHMYTTRAQHSTETTMHARQANVWTRRALLHSKKHMCSNQAPGSRVGSSATEPHAVHSMRSLFWGASGHMRTARRREDSSNLSLTNLLSNGIIRTALFDGFPRALGPLPTQCNEFAVCQ